MSLGRSTIVDEQPIQSSPDNNDDKIVALPLVPFSIESNNINIADGV